MFHISLPLYKKCLPFTPQFRIEVGSIMLKQLFLHKLLLKLVNLSAWDYNYLVLDSHDFVTANCNCIAICSGSNFCSESSFVSLTARLTAVK